MGCLQYPGSRGLDEPGEMMSKANLLSVGLNWPDYKVQIKGGFLFKIFEQTLLNTKNAALSSVSWRVTQVSKLTAL